MKHVLTLTLPALLLVCSCSPRRSQTPDAPIAASPEPQPTPDGILPSSEARIPFNSGWEYATILNWRPGNGLEANINPPRFSWPYLQDTVAEKWDQIPITRFQFQISGDPSFDELEVDIRDTDVNFYNALKPLPAGTWYWRVGYGKLPDSRWSDTRSFVIREDTPSWDRSIIADAAATIAAKPRPRSGPATGSWKELNQALKQDPLTRNRHTLMMQNAERILKLEWWNNFPKTDNLGRQPQNRAEKVRDIGILKDLTNVAYVYRLTGDQKYAGALPRIITMASWPRGGLLSPEGLSGHTKMPSQAAELFAVVYDWFEEELSPKDRATLKESIRWRLQDMYYDDKSIVWQMGDKGMRNYGIAYNGGSHPYQNYAWSMPAILLMAGDLEIADQLTELGLNYLTGVTLQEGPEEGYNEGHGYSNEKAGTLLDAAIVTELLLPELEIGKNPVMNNLVDWFAFLFCGPETLPWGDSWMRTARAQGGTNLRKLTVLTGSPLAKQLWQERGKGDYSENVRSLYNRPWFDFAVWERYREDIAAIPEEVEISDHLVLKEAGWVFDYSRPILSLDDYKQAVGLQMQMRPRGGYSHSFPSDGSFVWFGHGALLSRGGGWRSWASMGYSRDAISQNSILINGEGHMNVNPYQPKRPYIARPLAYERGKEFSYWASELTPGYPDSTGAKRVLRQVLRVNDVFIIQDELESAEPATFHWLFHVYQQDVDVRLGQNQFEYSVDGVRARVQLIAPGELFMENRMDQEGYKNPVTGKDHYPVDMKRAESRGIFKKYLSYPLQKNNIFVSNTEKASSFSYIAVLSCAPQGGELARVTELGPDHIQVTPASGDAFSVSFRPGVDADYVIDSRRVLP